MTKQKAIKQDIYVNKYDYLHYYTRCSEVAFLSNDAIEQAINQQISQYQQYLKNKDNLDEEDADDIYSELDVQDSYSIYREREFDNPMHLCESIANINTKTQASIIEGQKINAFAKEFLISQYPVDVVIDYDDQQYQSLKTNEQLAFEQTKADIERLLKANKSFILFQPVFIATTINQTKFVTKCDCLVYLNQKQCYLLQIKGTTSSQLIHFLDLLYQKYALQSFKELTVTNYYLCLVKYCKAAKNTVPFIIDPYINLTKTAPVILKDKLPVAEKDRIALKQRYKLGKEQLLIDNALCNNLNFTELYDWYKSNGRSERSANTFAKLLFNKTSEIINQLTSSFNEVIDELSKQKAKFNLTKRVINLFPCTNCKSKYQNCPYWSKCKELFKDKYLAGQTQFYPYLFSTIIFERFSQLDAYLAMASGKINSIPCELIKPEYQCFLKGESNVNQNGLLELWKQLEVKQKQVYFNFITLNSVIRCLDDTLPFSQIVVQCAISKVTNNQTKSIDENLIIDPQQINLDWFKSIIDHLYEGDECTYLVYNKYFETNRLQEIADLLKDEEYTKKITCICNNLFELSAFFGKSPKPLLLEPLHGYYSLQELIKCILVPSLPDAKILVDAKIINGAQAGAMISNRFFGLITNEEWTKTCISALNLYGANDVLAMKTIKKYLQQLVDSFTHQSKKNN